MADDQFDTSGMIALIPDNPKALAIPDGLVPDDLHCTLVFLGDAIDQFSDDLSAALKAYVAGLANTTAPITARVFAQSLWNADGALSPQGTPMKPCLVYQLDADPYLTTLQEIITGDTKNIIGNADYPDQHMPYKPHVAAAYDSTDVSALATGPGPVRFGTIRLALGTEHLDYPLTGTRDGNPTAYDDGRTSEMATKATTKAANADAEPVLGQPDENGQIPVRFPVLAVEGLATSDGRLIKPDALSHRALPISILAQTRTDSGHTGAEVVGHLTTIERVPGPEVTSQETGEPFPDGTYVWRGGGVIDPETDGGKKVQQGHLRGNSVDLSDVDYEEEFADDGKSAITVTTGKIAATTLCPVPAFADAYVELGDEHDDVRADTDTITASGAAQFHAAVLGDDCLTCELGLIEEFAAPGVDKRRRAFKKGLAIKGDKPDGSDASYPIENQADLDNAVHRIGTGDTDPEKVKAHIRKAAKKLGLKLPDSLTAAAAPLPPLDLFTDPKLDQPTPLTIDGDRIYGHIATWKSCHIGVQGTCQKPPHSHTDYSEFMTKAVRALDGDGQVRTVAVGLLTMDTGHAELTASARGAVAHYDHTGTAVARVAAGEDRYGIWIAGQVVPGLDDADRARLLASVPSGDWRRINGSMELVAVLQVNSGGFPVPRARVASGAPQSLIAAGAVLSRGVMESSGIDVDALAVKVAVLVAERLQLKQDTPETDVDPGAWVALRRDMLLADLDEGQLASKLPYGPGSKLWKYWTSGPGQARYLGQPYPWSALRAALLKEGVPANMVDGLTTNIMKATPQGRAAYDKGHKG